MRHHQPEGPDIDWRASAIGAIQQKMDSRGRQVGPCFSVSFGTLGAGILSALICLSCLSEIFLLLLSTTHKKSDRKEASSSQPTVGNGRAESVAQRHWLKGHPTFSQVPQLAVDELGARPRKGPGNHQRSYAGPPAA